MKKHRVYPARVPGPQDCMRTRAVHGYCDVCHKPAEPLHMPLRLHGWFCGEHCPCCSPAPAGRARLLKPPASPGGSAPGASPGPTPRRGRGIAGGWLAPRPSRKLPSSGPSGAHALHRSGRLRGELGRGPRSMVRPCPQQWLGCRRLPSLTSDGECVAMGAIWFRLRVPGAHAPHVAPEPDTYHQEQPAGATQAPQVATVGLAGRRGAAVRSRD